MSKDIDVRKTIEFIIGEGNSGGYGRMAEEISRNEGRRRRYKD